MQVKRAKIRLKRANYRQNKDKLIRVKIKQRQLKMEQAIEEQVEADKLKAN